MLDTFEEMDNRKLRNVVRRVRNRWRLRVVLRGAALTLAVGFLALLVLSFGLDTLRYRPWALFTFSAVTYLALLALLLRYLVFPLTRRVDDKRVALYIEEHEPDLEAQILSAVELSSEQKDGPRPERSEAFVRRTVERAVEQCYSIDFGRRVESPNLRRFGTVLAATAAGVMVAVILSPAFLRTGTSLLLMPWTSIAFANPYAIDVTPGDTQVARGSDQLVTATLVGFASDRVELGLKRGDGEWERWPMTVDEDSGDWSFLIFDLDDRSEYFVDSSGVRSPVFRIDVADVPYVEQIDVELRFPAYTGLSPQTIEDGGDIAALRDTEARLRVVPTVSVPAGRIVFEPDPLDDSEVETQVHELIPGDDGSFVATLDIVENGTYRVELQGFNGVMATASPDYFVEVLTDLPPTVRFETPGRDIMVSPVDESFLELLAEDDFGLTRLELLYTVNGGDERGVLLYDRATDTGTFKRELSASHTFYLEEEELVPGDFIAYYARAWDNGEAEASASTTTDIYFMEVRPFDREFRQGQQGGGGGRGGGGRQDAAFADRQKQIVAATFKLIRDEEITERQQWQSDLTTLAMMQGRLREQVELVLGRTSQRGAMQPGSEFQQMAEYLGQAIEQMVPAEERLGSFQPDEAMPPEQRALQFLQRAEALIREAQVAFGGGGGGGGGGNQALNEELADLLDLEMEKLRNQYETVQRGQQQQVDDQVDEALERLEELARRQQQELERSRRLANLPQNLSGGGGGDSQRQLAEQAEELARQLERLSRENSQPELMETARRLQEAADAMRRAAANANDRALAEGLNALNRLQQARDQLEGDRQRRLARDMDNALQQIEQMRESQEKIAEEVRELGAADPRAAAERMQRVLERKDELAGQAASLEEQVDEMARESRQDQREASRKLQDTASWMRDSKLSDKIRYSKGVAQQRLGGYAEQFEEQISQDLESLQEKLEEAAASIGESERDRLTASLEDAGDLVRRLESLEERMRQQAGLSPRQGEQQQQGQQGQQGEQGQQQGQENQQQGQQNQQGQRGQRGQQGQQGQRGQQGTRRLDPGQGSGARGAVDRRDGEAALGNWSRGGANVYPPDVARQFRREFDERLRDAEALRDRMAEQGLQVTDFDEVIDSMRALDFDGTPRGIDELRSEVIEDLKLFQYVLRRLADAEAGRRPLLSSSDEVPESYRALVEEYFRALSRESGRR